MTHKEECFCASCDNCGEIFNDGEYSLFLLESDVIDRLRNDGDWHAGDTDPDHLGKHYCPDCFKQDENIDDKIILDTSRTKPIEPAPQSPIGSQGGGYSREDISECLEMHVINNEDDWSRTPQSMVADFIASLPAIGVKGRLVCPSCNKGMLYIKNSYIWCDSKKCSAIFEQQDTTD